MSWIFALGFLAQGLFSARMLVQWVLSEKSRKVVSPTIYWQLSILASFIFFIYGWLRNDFAIILGQVFSYYVYIWNLNNKGYWQKLNIIIKAVLVLTPVIAAFFILYHGDDSFKRLFSTVPVPVIIFGSLGQILFTLRFIYQWWYSRAREESLLPMSFWILSLCGAAITISYGIFRKDPVLILGQSAGIVAYSRNLWLAIKNDIR